MTRIDPRAVAAHEAEELACNTAALTGDQSDYQRAIEAKFERISPELGRAVRVQFKASQQRRCRAPRRIVQTRPIGRILVAGRARRSARTVSRFAAPQASADPPGPEPPNSGLVRAIAWA